VCEVEKIEEPAVSLFGRENAEVLRFFRQRVRGGSSGQSNREGAEARGRENHQRTRVNGQQRQQLVFHLMPVQLCSLVRDIQLP